MWRALGNGSGDDRADAGSVFAQSPAWRLQHSLLGTTHRSFRLAVATFQGYLFIE